MGNVLEILLEELTWLVEKVGCRPYLTLNIDDLMSVSDEPYDWGFGAMNRYYLWKIEPQINVKNNPESIILIVNVLNFKPVHIISHYFYVQ